MQKYNEITDYLRRNIDPPPENYRWGRYQRSNGGNDIIQSFPFTIRRSFLNIEYHERRLPLLTPSTLTSQPFKNHNEHKQPYEYIIERKNHECIICFSNKKECAIIKECKHEFCKDCLITWFENLPKTCPICRMKIN
jgi:hypothetical protein